MALAGGNPYVVDHVADELGNTWRKAIAGTNDGNTDVEIWYANSAVFVLILANKLYVVRT